MRQSLDGLLRSTGYRVAKFDSGEAFLASAERSECACVISDINMPGGMSGIELSALLRKMDGGTPVILISAYADDDIRRKASSAGAKCLLKKPFAGDLIIEQVEQALAG